MRRRLDAWISTCVGALVRLTTYDGSVKPIEIRLRIPSNRNAPLLDENGYPLDMTGVRFRKLMTVTAIPKAAEALELTASGQVLLATVVRADWSDSDGRFIAACQYARRSITVEEQNALINDPEWSIVPLI
jgi:hypothetical protein